MDDLYANPLKVWVAALITSAVVLGVLLRRPSAGANARRTARQVVLVVVLIQAGLWGGGLVGFWAERIAEHREADAGTRMTISVVGIAVRVLLWTIVLLVILDNLWVSITALVTGLGIGGIAIALAVQNILGVCLHVLRNVRAHHRLGVLCVRVELC